jgi:glycerol-3-phosphate dehydrogenase (NAD(P)+)
LSILDALGDLAVKNKYQVLILGHGEMGHAMEYLLHRRHRLTVWERHPKPGTPPVALDTAAEQDFILFCLPANPHFELASRLRPHLRRDGICLSVAKGLDEQGRTAAQALSEGLESAGAFGVLYGPMISEEIRDGRPAFAQAGTTRADTYARVRELFSGTTLYLEHSTDIEGISWSAVLKNVYAILFGVADEMRLGDNTRGFLAMACVDELERIVAGLGGMPDTPRRLAGLGDLVTTATSAGSHHHEVGRRLARGQAETLTGEGVHTLKMVHAHRLFDSHHYPLFDLIGRLLADPISAQAQMQNFLNRLRH